jgi:hypothetical protein
VSSSVPEGRLLPSKVAEHATEAARWLLEMGLAGVPLTQTHSLARSVVREAVERRPEWWDTELHGAPYREAEVRVLEELHAGLRRLGFLRRRSRRLVTTVRGRQALAEPEALLTVLAGDLGGGDAFCTAMAATVIGALNGHPTCTHDELVAAVHDRALRDGWHDGTGRPPDEHELSWVVTEVLCRGEAYGLVVRQAGPDQPWWRRDRIALTDAGRTLFAPSIGGRSMSIMIFDAELTSVRGVRARVAVGADQHLTALHDAIQEAFGWWDDHLYSFWLDGRFWGDEQAEYTSPVVPDEAPQTADVPLAELGLQVGQKIAYVFDFGDEWRVKLALREHAEPDGGTYPRVLLRKGTAPPQYAALDEVDEPA